MISLHFSDIIDYIFNLIIIAAKQVYLTTNAQHCAGSAWKMRKARRKKNGWQKLQSNQNSPRKISLFYYIFSLLRSPASDLDVHPWPEGFNSQNATLRRRGVRTEGARWYSKVFQAFNIKCVHKIPPLHSLCCSSLKELLIELISC